MKFYLAKKHDGTASILQLVEGFTPEQFFAKCSQSFRDEHTGEYREIQKLPTGPDRHRW